MKTVLYESELPVRESERWLCWLTEEKHLVDKEGKRTGETKTAFLSVYFFGESAKVAQDRALTFWDDEKAKALAQTERGRKLGLSRKVSA